MSAAPISAPAPIVVRSRAWRTGCTIALLFMMAILIVLERVHTYSEPTERDIAGYAVIGHEMMKGRHLYTDLWERKPPLLYATFAAAQRLVGYGPGEIFLINVTVALVTLGGCYAAGRGGGGEAAGLIAAGLWVLLCGDPWMEANQPNAEVFVNAALTVAVALLIRRDRPGWRLGLGVGALFTIASMYEQHVIITCGTLAAAYLFAGRRADFRHRAISLCIAAGVGAASWLALAAYFAAVGRLPAAVNVLFHQLFSQFSLWHNLTGAMRPENLYPSFMTWAGGPVALVLLAVVAGGQPVQDRRHWIIWGGWALGTWFVVAIPGWFFPHYYQCWIPPMCIAGGWGAGRLISPTRWPRAVGPAAILVIMAVLGARELPPYRWSADEWSNRKYGFDAFGEQVYLGRRLATLLLPDERFWILGQDNTLYFSANQSPVTGLLFLYPVLDRQNKEYFPRLMNDLHRSRPPTGDCPLPLGSFAPRGQSHRSVAEGQLCAHEYKPDLQLVHPVGAQRCDRTASASDERASRSTIPTSCLGIERTFFRATKADEKAPFRQVIHALAFDVQDI